MSVYLFHYLYLSSLLVLYINPNLIYVAISVRLTGEFLSIKRFYRA